MLALAGWPCADELVIDSNGHTEMSEQHQHDEESDGCSPLCFCHCCHVHVQLPMVFEEYVADLPLESIKTAYLCSQTENSVSSLFRPPIV
jgi:hypothetical protein